MRAIPLCHEEQQLIQLSSEWGKVLAHRGRDGSLAPPHSLPRASSHHPVELGSQEQVFDESQSKLWLCGQYQKVLQLSV